MRFLSSGSHELVGHPKEFEVNLGVLDLTSTGSQFLYLADDMVKNDLHLQPTVWWHLFSLIWKLLEPGLAVKTLATSTS